MTRWPLGTGWAADRRAPVSEAVAAKLANKAAQVCGCGIGLRDQRVQMGLFGPYETSLLQNRNAHRCATEFRSRGDATERMQHALAAAYFSTTTSGRRDADDTPFRLGDMVTLRGVVESF